LKNFEVTDVILPSWMKPQTVRTNYAPVWTV